MKTRKIRILNLIQPCSHPSLKAINPYMKHSHILCHLGPHLFLKLGLSGLKCSLDLRLGLSIKYSHVRLHMSEACYHLIQRLNQALLKLVQHAKQIRNYGARGKMNTLTILEVEDGAKVDIVVVPLQ